MAVSPSSSSSSVQTLLKSGFSPTLKSINQFLHSLSKPHKYKLISHLFSQINRHKIKCKPQTHSIFTRVLPKVDKFEEAEHFMKTQIEKSSKVSGFGIWDSLIRAFCDNNKDPEKGLSILKDCLRNYGILPFFRHQGLSILKDCLRNYGILPFFRHQSNLRKTILL